MDSVCEAAGGLPLRKVRRVRSDTINVDRLPPHMPEMEQGVLGCILLSPNDCLPQCILKFRAGSEVFYDLRHQIIWRELVAMREALAPVDVLTLYQRLKDLNLSEQVGGIPYLNALQEAVPSAANLDYYADIVQEKYLVRKMISTCSKAVAKGYDYDGDIDALLDEVERDILSIRERRLSQRATIKELVQKSIGRIEERWGRQGAISGLSTGFCDLDRYTDGLCEGDLIVPSAYTSVGKTSLLMNIIEHVVLIQKRPAAVFTFEMTAEQLVTRFLCCNARVNWKRIGEGWMAESDFPKLTSAAGRTSAAPLYIIEDVETVEELREESRRLKKDHGIEVMGADYIQRIRARVARGANREQEIAAVSNGLKSTAKELKIPVIAPSQLNDDGMLRESRAIGMDADGVWNLSPLEDGATETFQHVDLWLRKNRNGPRDVCVHLNFFKEFTRFESAAKVSDEDVPQTARNPHAD